MDLADAALRERLETVVEEIAKAVYDPIGLPYDPKRRYGFIAQLKHHVLRLVDQERDAARAEQREARMLYNEAVTILLECAHGDEQTCGCKDRALERLAGLAAIRAQGGEK